MSAGERLIITLLRMIIRLVGVCVYRMMYPIYVNSDEVMLAEHQKILDESRKLLEQTEMYE